MSFVYHVACDLKRKKPIHQKKKKEKRKKKKETFISFQNDFLHFRKIKGGKKRQFFFINPILIETNTYMSAKAIDTLFGKLKVSNS